MAGDWPPLRAFRDGSDCGVFHPAGDLRRVFPGAAPPARKTGSRLRHQSGHRCTPHLSAQRSTGVCHRADRVGARAHRDAAGLVLPVLGLCGGRRHGLHHGLYPRGGVQPAARHDQASDLGVVGRAGPGAGVLQQPRRHQDVFLCRRGDDVVAQRPLRGRVPLQPLWRRRQSRRLPLRGLLHLLHPGLLHL